MSRLSYAELSESPDYIKRLVLRSWAAAERLRMASLLLGAAPVFHGATQPVGSTLNDLCPSRDLPAHHANAADDTV